ncbi:MAG TPA: hypothetical protein VGR13_05145, partial [Actinomycetota bacterium]|nr:hypothetical protein [Actinomycetota bacterium]
MPERRFTRNELTERAGRMGLSGSGRYIDDWVRQGLLAPPQAPGRGRSLGGRERGTWGEEQFEIFQEIVASRVARVPIPVLCNIPVYVWLLRGEIAVPLVEVRRAMATWAKRGRRSRWRAAKDTGRDVVAELEHPMARPADKKLLEELIALSAFRGKLDPEALLAAQRVFDPGGEGRWRGPSGMELTAEDYVRWAGSQLEIRRLLSDPDQERLIPDEHFWSARLALGAGLVGYARLQPSRVREPGAAHFFPTPTEENVKFMACLALSMTLGFALQAARGPLPGFAELVSRGESLLQR